MIDIKPFRDKPDDLIAALNRRNSDSVANFKFVKDLLYYEKLARNTTTRLEELQAEQNRLSKEFPKLKGFEKTLASRRSKFLKQIISDYRERLDVAMGKFKSMQYQIPNLVLDDVPDGYAEDDNIELKHWGTPRKFTYEIEDHVTLGEKLGMMDFEAGTRIAQSSRFCVLSGQLAQLERALGQFMLDVATENHHFKEMNVPIIVGQKSMQGTGQLPKFEDDLYRTGDQYLIPTGEVPLTNLVRDKILEAGVFPLRYVALTPCFRAEAGSAGKDVRGLIRQHQFNKVELVSISDGSRDESEVILACAEDVLKRLGLPYRVVQLCAGDTGFSAAKTIDLEVWLPGQNQYREISSVSCFGQFQARRMNARFKETSAGFSQYVHTYNGSGLAVGRTLVAVMENYQQKDGTIHIPSPLVPYMGGKTKIEKK